MKVDLINKTDDRIEVQVFDEGHSLCAPLNDFVFERIDDIDMSGYKIRHPLKPDPSVYVKIKEESKKKPEEILIEASEDFLAKVKEFQDAFTKAISSSK